MPCLFKIPHVRRKGLEAKHREKLERLLNESVLACGGLVTLCPMLFLRRASRRFTVADVPPPSLADRYLSDDGGQFTGGNPYRYTISQTTHIWCAIALISRVRAKKPFARRSGSFRPRGENLGIPLPGGRASDQIRGLQPMAALVAKNSQKPRAAGSLPGVYAVESPVHRYPPKNLFYLRRIRRQKPRMARRKTTRY